jgi:NAD+ diphosphatase
MLVEHGNRLLLGRSPNWPEGMYSALAGFVEPGETPEAAVAREVVEETGITTTDIRYLGSQPWPFPNSLMLGYIARAVDDTIRLDDELDDAFWISREELLAVLSGENTRITPARPGSIAYAMIRLWLAGHI